MNVVRTYLADALLHEYVKGLLDGLLTKDATRYHDAMRRHVRVNREILAAWAEHSHQG